MVVVVVCTDLIKSVVLTGNRNQQPEPATGMCIIVYILMTTFWRGIAFQPTDAHWYRWFYVISLPSGGHRYEQPTQKGLYILGAGMCVHVC